MTARSPKQASPEKVLIGLGLIALVIILISIGAVFSPPPDLPFANEQYAMLWLRSEAPSVQSGRPWYWGERPWLTSSEFYRQSPTGLQVVQYFDKGRMDEAGSDVMGRLVWEMRSGKIQLGDQLNDIDQRAPAQIPIVGDLQTPYQAISYADFAALESPQANDRWPNLRGQTINSFLQAGPLLSTRPDLAISASELVWYDETAGHNVPAIFWDFLNRQGFVQMGGQITSDRLIDWERYVGRPISEAYWTSAYVAGQEREILVQLYERRVLTYTPSNPAGFEVEFANVGQHYLAWRYPNLNQPWKAEPNQAALYFGARAADQAAWSIYAREQGATQVLAEELPELVLRPAWQNRQRWLVGDLKQPESGYRQLYAFDTLQSSSPLRLSYSDGTRSADDPFPGPLPLGAANDYDAAISPDGSKILFVSDRTGHPEIYLMAWGAGRAIPLTQSNCISENPTWLPDGSGLLWVNNCDGDFDLYRAKLIYSNDSSAALAALLVDVEKLSETPYDERFPSVSPDGERIAFSANQNGVWQTNLMPIDASNAPRSSGSSSNELLPIWAPDSAQIAVLSDQAGQLQIHLRDSNNRFHSQIGSLDGAQIWMPWSR
jgi:hypothetical protein